MITHILEKLRKECDDDFNHGLSFEYRLLRSRL